MLGVFPIAQDNANKYYAAGMPERERRMRWIAACRLDNSLDVMRHSRICSIQSDEGLCPTKLNPISSIFAFPQHLRRKPPKNRGETSKAAKGNTSDLEEWENKNKKLDVNRLERRIFCTEKYIRILPQKISPRISVTSLSCSLPGPG